MWIVKSIWFCFEWKNTRVYFISWPSVLRCDIGELTFPAARIFCCYASNWTILQVIGKGFKLAWSANHPIFLPPPYNKAPWKNCLHFFSSYSLLNPLQYVLTFWSRQIPCQFLVLFSFNLWAAIDTFVHSFPGSQVYFSGLGLSPEVQILVPNHLFHFFTW